MSAVRSTFNVCIRCQLRSELRALSPSPFRNTLQPQRRSQSTTSSNVIDSTEEERGRSQSPGTASSKQQSGRRAAQKDYKKPQYRFGVSTTSWKKVNVHQDSVALGVNSLGKPAQIRIVRDKPTRNRDENFTKWKTAESTAEQSNTFNEEEFAKALAPASGETSRTAVNENIENLRRIFFALNHAEGFSRRQCAAVAGQLMDGVTSSQLTAYVNDKTSSPRAQDVDDLERWYDGRLITRSRWFGGVTEFPTIAQKRMAESSWALLRTEQSIITPNPKPWKRLKSKERLVQRVLREVWGVRLSEELADGELDMHIKDPDHMQLLMQHYDDIFKARAEKFDVRIQVDQPQSVVRISGEYGLTFDVFRLIYSDLMDIKTERIHVDAAASNESEHSNEDTRAILATEAYQQYLQQVSRTMIVPRQRNEGSLVILDHLDVLYFGSHQRAFNDVQRLVAQTLQRKDPSKTQILCDRQSGSATPTEVPIETGGMLPIHERYANWKRWSFSQNLDREKEIVRRASFAPSIIYSPASAREIANAAKAHLVQAWVAGSSAETAGHWQPSSSWDLSATIGYLVHRADRKTGSRMESAWHQTYKTRKEQDRAIEETFAAIINVPRELIMGVPALPIKLENVVSSCSPSENELRIILRPQKVVSGDYEDLTNLPELGLHLALDENKRQVRLKTVQLLREWRETDVMLPTQATDVRLVSRSLIKAAEKVDPAVLEFVSESDLDIWSSGRLRTPAGLTLAVPRSACSDWPVAPARAPGAVEAVQATDHVEVEYLFKSLEHVSRMPAMYQGHRLYYSTVEAGRTGGRWDEVQFEIEDVGRELAGGTGAVGDQAFLDWFDGVCELNARLGS